MKSHGGGFDMNPTNTNLVVLVPFRYGSSN
jgi:hypothetical protein